MTDKEYVMSQLNKRIKPYMDKENTVQIVIKCDDKRTNHINLSLDVVECLEKFLKENKDKC